jgi:hypothetical protein
LTSINISRYCAGLAGKEQETFVENTTPVAAVVAWMMAGGDRALDAAEARNADHRRALEAARPRKPTLAARLAVAIAALRSEQAAPEPICCPSIHHAEAAR